MTQKLFALMLALLLPGTLPALLAGSPDAHIERGTLIFEDDFNRSEIDPSKEQLGKQWVTNSAHRAYGKKQAWLTDNTLIIVMAKGANHGVSVRHDAPFDDGIVQARFKIHDAKGIKFNFNDPAAKDVSHAGHIARVAINPKGLTIGDDKTGIFDLAINKKRKDKSLPTEEKAKLSEFLKTKSATFVHTFQKDHWYLLTIVNIGPQFEVFIDDEKVGAFSSSGLDHKVKQNLAFAVSGKATIDDLKIWSLDK